eukprot:8338063-Pyramimonas_sp.AAC.1
MALASGGIGRPPLGRPASTPAAAAPDGGPLATRDLRSRPWPPLERAPSASCVVGGRGTRGNLGPPPAQA